MNEYTKIYPSAPTDGVGDNFRLQKAFDSLSSLEKEVKHYENVRKKYKRSQSAFSKVSIGAGTLSVALGSSGLGTALSGFGLIVGLPLGALSGVFGITSAACGGVAKKLSNKVSKHDATVATAKAKVNSIRDLVSKSLKDNKISDEEFSLILNKLDKFQDMKRSIRRKSRTRSEEKNVDMAKVRDEVRAEILKNLTQKNP